MLCNRQYYTGLLQDERQMLYAAINILLYLLLPFCSPFTLRDSSLGTKVYLITETSLKS